MTQKTTRSTAPTLAGSVVAGTFVTVSSSPRTMAMPSALILSTSGSATSTSDRIVPGLREAGAEDRTHRARADNRDSHRANLLGRWYAIIQAYLSGVNQRPPASAPPSTMSV